MKTTSLRARALACALLTGTAYCGLAASPAAAQTAREHRALDSNGVMAFVEGSIGSGEGELALVRSRIGSGNGNWHNSSGGHQWDGLHLEKVMAGGGAVYSVHKDNRFEKFTAFGTLPSGSSLTAFGTGFLYRSADGTAILFGDPSGSAGSGSNYCNGSSGQGGCTALPESIASPDGRRIEFGWGIFESCTDEPIEPGVPRNCAYFARIESVSNSFGYRIAFDYALNGNSGVNQAPPPDSWQRRVAASLYNDAVSATTAQASVSYSYPAANMVDVTDLGGRQWRFTGNGNAITGIRRPGAASSTTSVSYGGSAGTVSSVTRDGVTTGYSHSVSGTTATMIVTNALSQATTIVSDLTIGRPTSITDPLGHMTSFTYDNGRPKRVTQPEGNYVEHTYDSRGNVIQTVAVPKGGSGPAILTSAIFDSSCANPATCNQPSSTTDARGNVTHYTYYAAHGGLESVTAPAPAGSGVQPQTGYSYTLVDGEYQLTGISQCQSTSSCAGTADEVKAAIGYDANGNVVSTATGNGSGTLTASGAMTYDAMGNLLTVDGPLAGEGDISRIRYDAGRRVVGTVSPDPDGAGPLKRRAVRNSYDPATGLLTKVERGNVDSDSDLHWAAFDPAEAVETAYDPDGRPVTSRLVAGSTVHALSQTGYDALGRPECSARRMNPAEYGSTLPGACSLGNEGNHGPDRIAKTSYDPAGRVAAVTTALHTGAQAIEAATTYTANGLVETVTDGEGNKTTYEYDGHDRLLNTRFPVAAKGAAASAPTSGATADFEQLTYESLAGGTRTSGLVVAFRNRNGSTIAFTHDALGRLIQKSVPASPGGAPGYSVHYGHDLRGLPTFARFGSPTGIGIAFTHDALGRRLTESSDMDGTARTFNSQYDLAGNRTQLTANLNSYYQAYTYNLVGERLTSGGSVNVTARFGYDDLGRRVSLGQGTGSVTSATAYDYASPDGSGRLAGLAHLFAGTGPDLSLGFAYNPAGQIVSATRSDNAYSWTGHGSGTTSTTADGRNRIAGWGSPLDYDKNGNLVSDGSTTFTYDAENRLVAASGAKNASLAYDPLGRLWQISSSAGTIRFVHDGDRLTAELNGAGTLLRTYAHGPGTDEPLAIHQPGVTPRFLKADERGSIVAIADAAGNVLATNSYDEYGVPASTNSGRFGYTGQAWLPELGLYYYKARMYEPRLGRFLQEDPIGYGGGMNLHSYVGGDPVNGSDPSGHCRAGLNFDGEWVDPPTGSHICGGHGAASVYGGIAGSMSGYTTAGAGGAGGPTFGEAHAAAKKAVGGYGSKAVNAAADYLMGHATLGTVYASLLSAEVAAQEEGRGYLQWFRISNDGTVDDIKAMMRDPDIRAAVAWSFDKSTAQRREWAFWVGQRGNDYFAYKPQHGAGSLINVFEFRPAGSNVAFHMHPFLHLPQGLSGRDLLRADRNGILFISISWNGPDWADYRR